MIKMKSPKEVIYDELYKAFRGIIKGDCINETDMLLEIVDATLYAQNVINEAYYRERGA